MSSMDWGACPGHAGGTYAGGFRTPFAAHSCGANGLGPRSGAGASSPVTRLCVACYTDDRLCPLCHETIAAAVHDTVFASWGSSSVQGLSVSSSRWDVTLSCWWRSRHCDRQQGRLTLEDTAREEPIVSAGLARAASAVAVIVIEFVMVR